MEKRLLVPVVALSLAVVMAGCGSNSTNTTAEKSGGAGVTTADVKKADVEKTAEAVAKAPSSFSAEMITAMPDGKSMTSKMMVGGEDKIRMEMADQVIIVRRDKGKMWMLNKSNKTAMEMPVNEQMIKEASKTKFDAAKKLKPVGKETVDGYLCDKYVTTDKDVTTTTWVARKVGMPVKIESEGTVVKFKNISTDKQPASLFELDSGYKTIQMPDMSKMDLPKNVPMPR